MLGMLGNTLMLSQVLMQRGCGEEGADPVCCLGGLPGTYLCP